MFGGFLTVSRSSGGMPLPVLNMKEGTGEDLNSSMRSVSGTGSMVHGGSKSDNEATWRAFLMRSGRVAQCPSTDRVV